MVIVDASVAFKWLVTTEDGHEQAMHILREHLEKKNTIIVPDLILYEITNALTTKTFLDEKKLAEHMNVLEEYALTILPVDFALLAQTSVFSRMYRVSVYDSVYAILAQNNNCELISADLKFVKQVNLPFVKLL